MRDSAAPAPHSGLVVALCVLVAALEGYDIQAFGVAAPRLIAEFGLSASMVGVAGGAAMVGLMIGAWAGGSLAERFGTKAVLIGATMAFGACSIATAFAGSVSALILFRLLTGLGFGGVMPNLLSVATRLRPAGNHAGIATLIFCGMPVGGALLAETARLLGTPVPWRTLFLIGGAMPLIVAPALMLALPRFGHQPPTAREPLAGILFGGGRAGRTIALWMAFILALLLLYLLLNWLPLLVIGKGLPETVGSTAAMTFNLGGIVGALALGQLADRTGYGTTLSIGAAIMVVGAAAMLATGSVPITLVAAALLGGGTVSLQYLLYAAAPTAYPAGRNIAAAGAAIGMGRLGSIAGPLLAGVGRDAGLSVDALLIMMIPAVIAVALFGAFGLRDRDR
jgi:AAHS family 3-hydroxyphenylpropionic acid transporter